MGCHNGKTIPQHASAAASATPKKTQLKQADMRQMNTLYQQISRVERQIEMSREMFSRVCPIISRQINQQYFEDLAEFLCESQDTLDSFQNEDNQKIQYYFNLMISFQEKLKILLVQAFEFVNVNTSIDVQINSMQHMLKQKMLSLYNFTFQTEIPQPGSFNKLSSSSDKSNGSVEDVIEKMCQSEILS